MPKILPKNKILIHLIYHEKEIYFDLFDKQIKPIPFEITQNGIAKTIGISRTRTSRYLKEMRKEKFIEEKTVSVENFKRKVRAYFLTIIGKMKAGEIRREIEARYVLLKVQEQEIMTRVADIGVHIRREVPLIKIINNLNLKENFFDASLLDIEIPKITKIFANLENELPKITIFFDRKKELKELNDWLNSKTNVFFIYGVHGIGKSYLLAKFYLSLKGNKNIFWYKIFIESLRNISLRLSDFLCFLKKYKLRDYIIGRGTEVKLEVEDIVEILEEEFKDLDGLIIIDNFENANKEVFELLSSLVNKAEKFENVKLIIISQEKQKFYDRRFVLTNVVKEKEIFGLDEEGTYEFLRAKNIEEHLFKKFYEITKGHPSLLSLINRIEEINTPSDVKKFLEENIFYELKKDEVDMINMISVYRKPVLESGFITKTSDYLIFYSLLKKFFIKEIYLQGYLISDIMKNIILYRLTKEEKIRYNLKAVKYYKKREDYIEIIYHYIQAEKYSQVVRILREKIIQIIDKGLSSELNPLFDLMTNELKLNENYEFAKNFLIEEEIYEFFFYNAETLFPIGDWDNCLKFYEKIINTKNKNLLMKVYKNIAHVKREKGDFETAMNFYEKALGIAKKLNKKIVIADIYRGIGKIYWRKGQHEFAIEFLEKGLSLVENTNELSLLADIYIDFGAVYGEKMEFDKELEYYNKALKILEPVGYLYKLGKLYNNMGVCYYGKEEWNKALEIWEKNIEITRKTKSKKQLGYSLFNAADILARDEPHQEQKALNYLNESEKILNEVGDKIGISYVYMNYGIVYSYLNDWKKSEENFIKSIEIVNDLKLPYLTAERYYEFAQMYKEKKDKKKYKENLINSLKYYKEVKVIPIIEKIEEELKSC